MKLLVKRIEAHQPDGYKTPLYLVPCDSNGERRCKVTIVCLYKEDGQESVLEQTYPAALVALKDDSPDKECSRIVLLFDLLEAQDT